MSEVLLALLKAVTGSAGALCAYAAAFKLIAITLGPSGTGLLSILRQFQQTAVVAATLSGQTALVQGAASRTAEDRRRYLQTVLCIFLAGWLLTTVVIACAVRPLSTLLFDEAGQNLVLITLWMTIPIGLQVLSAYCAGVLNAGGSVGGYATVQLATAIGFAALAYPVSLLPTEQVPFGLSCLLMGSSLLGLVTGIALIYRRGNHWRWPSLAMLFSPSDAREFLRLASVLTVGAVLSTGSLLVLRALVAHRLGLPAVGYFDAAWTISMGHVMLLLGAMQTYYLPKLSSHTDIARQKQLIVNILTLCIAAVPPLIVSVLVTKSWLVSILYSHEYLAALDTLNWTLIGDSVKIFSWVLAMPMLAFAEIRSVLISELVWNGLFAGGSLLGLALGGRETAVGAAFLIAYIGYLLVTGYYVHCRYRLAYPPALLAWMAYGFAVIITSSVLTWSVRDVYFPIAVPCLLLSLMPALFVLPMPFGRITELLGRRLSRQTSSAE